MKVLISAYACEPDKGSEPGVGWNWAVQAARSHEVWVLTRGALASVIEREIKANPIERLHFVYHDLPRPWSFFLKHSDTGGYLHYYAWQYTVLATASRLDRQVDFDIAQHVTIAGVRFPSFLMALGVPYVWGPVGGGERAPLNFLGTFGLRSGLRQALRDLSQFFVKFDPLVRRTARNARLIVTTTESTRAALPVWARRKAVVELQIGLKAGEVPWRRGHTAGGTFRVAYIGRLVYWKGLHLGLQAFAMARRTNLAMSLTIIATGPEEQRLRREAARLGLAGAVQFAGRMDRPDALRLLADHDCLLFPSFQDSGGAAVIEAMAAGLAVICLDTGGPAVTVTDDVGIRVPVRSPSQVVAGLANALVALAADPARRKRMGQAGKQRVQDVFLWDRKADVIDALYEQALELSS